MKCRSDNERIDKISDPAVNKMNSGFRNEQDELQV